MAKLISLFVLLTCVLCVVPGQAQPTAVRQPQTDPARDEIVSGISGVIATGTRVQFMRDGFNGTEGIVAMPDGGMVFCEQNANKIIKIDNDGNFSTYLEESNRAIGLAYDSRGRLIAAQSREPRIGVLTSARVTLADTFDGQALVRPNDLVIDRKGGIYFTDPVPSPQVAFREPPLGRKPLLFYITPKSEIIKLMEHVTEPNGIQLSPDEKTLYAANGDHIVAFDVQPDGSVSKPRKFAAINADGMAVDNKGRVYAAVTAGIQVISPNGELLGLIPAPVRIQSIAFGGTDRKTLYAVGSGAVYHMAMLAEGIKSRAK